MTTRQRRGGRSRTCTDVETSAASKFAQMAALTTYARNEQVVGSIPQAAPGPHLRNRPGEGLRTPDLVMKRSIFKVIGVEDDDRMPTIAPKTSVSGWQVR